MTQAKEASTVKINFTGKLDDGTIIDSTYADPEDDSCQEHGPMELTLGEGDFYVPVETALVGMCVGEKKTVTITPDDAFGDFDPEDVFKVKRSELPEEITPEVGMGLEVTGEDDDLYMVTIVKVTDEEVSLDANHPLAGEELTYEFELAEIL
ncbi:MAG: FKBP-type peptidyl-prolyl cis-trans isomerase [Desulfuromonadales bacterium]|nr:FKBP-type peptidyl-prolyl cis-trans isomerase [Desulfuromonadales bacterium]